MSTLVVTIKSQGTGGAVRDKLLAELTGPLTAQDIEKLLLQLLEAAERLSLAREMALASS